MAEDIVEKPVCKILFRQSSLETRLEPANLSDENSSDDNDDDEKERPKIVNYQFKSPTGNGTLETISETKADEIVYRHREISSTEEFSAGTLKGKYLFYNTVKYFHAQFYNKFKHSK